MLLPQVYRFLPRPIIQNSARLPASYVETKRRLSVYSLTVRLFVLHILNNKTINKFNEIISIVLIIMLAFRRVK